MLLASGSSVATLDSNGHSALDVACEHGHLAVVRQLAGARHAGAKFSVLRSGAASAAMHGQTQCLEESLPPCCARLTAIVRAGDLA